MKTGFLCLASALLLAGCASSPGLTENELAALSATYQDADGQAKTTTQTKTTTTESHEDEEHHGIGSALLWYIPNRIDDVLDIVRARLRVGPGFEVGARVTQLVSFNLGGYTSIFVGLPGPRRERAINWPVGIESMAGAQLSVFDGTNWGGDAPHYGVLEIGLGMQLLLIGFDLGVDPWEAVDFVTGIVFIDPMDDDIL